MPESRRGPQPTENPVRFALTAIFALAATIGALAQPKVPAATADEKKAIELVARLGGKAEIDAGLPAEARVSAKFDAATDFVLLSLKKAPQIGSLDAFDATHCTDRGFAALKDLPQLRKLILGKSEMNLPRVTAIAQCKQLRTLYLAGSGLTDADLAGLKKLTLLESLDVSDNPITDRGMVHLKALERLRALGLAKTGITDKAFGELKALEGLRSLNVGATRVTPDAADAFADEMPSLRGVRR
jgi:Leucine-rich repeat (LRR) protein